MSQAADTAVVKNTAVREQGETSADVAPGDASQGADSAGETAAPESIVTVESGAGAATIELPKKKVVANRAGAKPAMKKPVSKKPAARKPPGKKPVDKKAVAEESVTQESVIQAQSATAQTTMEPTAGARETQGPATRKPTKSETPTVQADSARDAETLTEPESDLTTGAESTPEPAPGPEDPAGGPATSEQTHKAGAIGTKAAALAAAAMPAVHSFGQAVAARAVKARTSVAPRVTAAQKFTAQRFAAAQRRVTTRLPRAAAPSAPKRLPSPAFTNAVVISGLTKSFGTTNAVDGIDLEVPKGSFYGLIGPNGAGKTTTLSMIAGLLKPDSGQLQVCGIDVRAQPNQSKRRVGVLPDQLRLFDRLTGAQLLYYAGSLRGLGHKAIRSRSEELAQSLGLADALDRLVSDYSAGMRKKIGLAAAMIHTPDLLVLDEPFESVDVVSADSVVEALLRYVADGGTVLASSHGMALIEQVCSHVAVMAGGRIVASGPIAEVRDGKSLQELFPVLVGNAFEGEGD